MQSKTKPLLFDEEILSNLLSTYIFTLNKVLKKEFEEETMMFKGRIYNKNELTMKIIFFIVYS